MATAKEIIRVENEFDVSLSGNLDSVSIQELRKLARSVANRPYPEPDPED